MEKYIFFVLVLVFAFTIDDVQKEKIVLDWSGKSNGFDKEALVFFENIDLNSSEKLPIYTRLYNLDSKSKNYRFVVQNPKYEQVKSAYSPILLDLVTEDIRINNEVFISNGKRNVELQITPLKKKENKLYKLVSFELKRFSDHLKNASLAVQWKNSSVLSSGKWVKIATVNKGVYKIPYSKLKEWGFNNPLEVGIFGSGATHLSEDPGDITYDDLEQCAIWRSKNNGEDCLFFYAPGAVKWSLNEEGILEHKLNDYAQQGYFFVGNANSEKKVQLLQKVEQVATKSTSTFTEVGVKENDNNNLLRSGKQWFGSKFLNSSSQKYNFLVKGIDSSEAITLKVNAAARSSAPSWADVSLNGNSVGKVNFRKVNKNITYSLYAAQSEELFEVSNVAGAFELEITYKDTVSGAEAWLDYVTLNYRRFLEVNDDVLFFRDAESLGDGNVVEFAIENVGETTKVFDVSDVNNVKEIPFTKEGTRAKIKRPSSELKEYAVFNAEGNFNEPTLVKTIENQNLHALSPPEYIIISHSTFMSSAEKLADFHRTHDGMTVEVVDVDKVYNEFSSGTKNATGIRNFIKMLHDKANALKYVLLLGKGSYDNKELKQNSKSYIPTYQSEESLEPTYSFVSDDYFVLLDAGESVYRGAIDLGIGRIPATTVYEAELVVDKVKRYYMPETLGNWRNKICFIGDDDDSADHMTKSEQLANTINEDYGEFVTNKVYFDAYVEEVTPAGTSYPEVKAAINEQVKNGVLVLNYIGHANDKSLAHENVIDVSDINSWSNKNQLPIFVTATCEFSRFDSDNTSAGEYVLFNPNGGGIGLFSTTRVVYASANFRLSKSFYNYIFKQDDKGEHYRMGDVMRLAKTNISSRINKRNFSLLADPALKLSYPKYKIETTSINQKNITDSSPDTIGTLEKVTITGEVTDYFGNKKDDFNGEIVSTVFDKAVQMKSLGNGGQKPITFTVQENIIHKGKATVENGAFTFSFVVPKDISYKLGQGKIIYYSHNGKDDAHGAHTNFYIGGSGANVIDDKGPDINLFLNSTSFKSGDKTNRNPQLLAYLSDDNGINTVSLGIGHDITAVIDNDYSNVFVLNNYYQSEKDDYKKGVVKFPFKGLSQGKHTIKLKAWDVANNSSEVEIEFEVSGEFIISEVSNYPNPITDHTHFIIKHNLSDEKLDVIFDIYDQRGRKIDQFQRQVGSNAGVTNPIRWDLKELSVSPMPGIYIYRAILKNSEGIVTSKSGKMIVVR